MARCEFNCPYKKELGYKCPAKPGQTADEAINACAAKVSEKILANPPKRLSLDEVRGMEDSIGGGLSRAKRARKINVWSENDERESISPR